MKRGDAAAAIAADTLLADDPDPETLVVGLRDCDQSKLLAQAALRRPDLAALRILTEQNPHAAALLGDDIDAAFEVLGRIEEQAAANTAAAKRERQRIAAEVAAAVDQIDANDPQATRVAATLVASHSLPAGILEAVAAEQLARLIENNDPRAAGAVMAAVTAPQYPAAALQRLLAPICKAPGDTPKGRAWLQIRPAVAHALASGKSSDLTPSPAAQQLVQAACWGTDDNTIKRARSGYQTACERRAADRAALPALLKTAGGTNATYWVPAVGGGKKARRWAAVDAATWQAARDRSAEISPDLAAQIAAYRVAHWGRFRGDRASTEELIKHESALA